MKHLFILLTACILSGSAGAQINAYYVIGSSGSVFTTDQGSASFTVGEMAMVKTFSIGNHVLTQGFQQGNMIKSRPTSLPVTLLDFEGYNKDGANHLLWQTASEIDNAGFEVQRLNAKNEFDDLGFVAGHGNSNSLHDYSYDDKQAPDGENYYRLKQVDVDGHFTYSDIVSIYSGETLSTEISVYPMPVVNFLNIVIHNGQAATATMTVSNVVGATVYDGPIDLEKGTTNAIIDMRAYAPGQYFIRLTTGSTSKTMHIVRQ